MPAFVLGIAALAPQAARALCGDGVLDSGGECDDLDTVSGDGCSSTCAVEHGWECVDASFALAFDEVIFDDGARAPSWSLSADSRTVTQSENAKPAVYVSTLPAVGVSMTFELSVNTSSDDDFIGWVIGYDSGEGSSSSADWLLFDWKKANQANGSCTGYAGLAMSRVSGAITSSAHTWCHTGPICEIARASTIAYTGWNSYATNTIQVDAITTQADV